ncbi:MAG: hypothetical protein IMX03_00815 [Brockia lithotrophica]|nr:hypothetical protein [Brockia lithotrophica]
MTWTPSNPPSADHMNNDENLNEKRENEEKEDEECENEECKVGEYLGSSIPWYGAVFYLLSCFLPIFLINPRDFFKVFIEIIFRNTFFPTTYGQISKTLIYQLLTSYVDLRLGDFFHSYYTTIVLLYLLLALLLVWSINAVISDKRYENCMKKYKNKIFFQQFSSEQQHFFQILGLGQKGTGSSSIVVGRKFSEKEIRKICSKKIGMWQILMSIPILIGMSVLYLIVTALVFIFTDTLDVRSIFIGKFEHKYITYQRAVVSAYIRMGYDPDRFKQLAYANEIPADSNERYVYYALKKLDNVELKIHPDALSETYSHSADVLIKLYDSENRKYSLSKFFFDLDNIRIRAGEKLFVSIIPHTNEIVFIHPSMYPFEEKIFSFLGKVKSVKAENRKIHVEIENLYGFPVKDLFMDSERYKDLINYIDPFNDGGVYVFYVYYDKDKNKFFIDSYKKKGDVSYGF